MLELVIEEVFVDVGEDVWVPEGVAVDVSESDPVAEAVEVADDVTELVTDQVGVDEGLWPAPTWSKQEEKFEFPEVVTPM